MLVDALISCPHCGESWTIAVDTSQGSYETVDDCAICCRPMTVRVECEPGEVLAVETEVA